MGTTDRMCSVSQTFVGTCTCIDSSLFASFSYYMNCNSLERERKRKKCVWQWERERKVRELVYHTQSWDVQCSVAETCHTIRSQCLSAPRKTRYLKTQSKAILDSLVYNTYINGNHWQNVFCFANTNICRHVYMYRLFPLCFLLILYEQLLEGEKSVCVCVCMHVRACVVCDRGGEGGERTNVYHTQSWDVQCSVAEICHTIRPWWWSAPRNTRFLRQTPEPFWIHLYNTCRNGNHRQNVFCFAVAALQDGAPKN